MVEGNRIVFRQKSFMNDSVTTSPIFYSVGAIFAVSQRISSLFAEGIKHKKSE